MSRDETDSICPGRNVRPRRRRPRRLLVGVGLLALVALHPLVAPSGCRALLRYPGLAIQGGSPGPATPEEPPNRFLLTNDISDQVLVEIDFVEGRPPVAGAVELLRARLGAVLPAGKRLEIEVDDAIPAAAWKRLVDSEGRSGSEAWSRLAERYLDEDPELWIQRELIYVLYVPRSTTSAFGLSTRLQFERRGRVASVPTVMMFTEPLDRRDILWLRRSHVEGATLIHEFGHELGLTRNLEHSFDRTHCGEPQCVMVGPRLRCMLYNAPRALFTGKLPTRYCDRCLADLTAARNRWRAFGGAADTARVIQTRRVQDVISAAGWLRRNERGDEALALLEDRRRDTDDPRLTVSLISTLRSLRANEDAVRIARTWLEQDSAAFVPRRLLAEALVDAGRPEEALSLIAGASGHDACLLATLSIRPRLLARQEETVLDAYEGCDLEWLARNAAVVMLDNAEALARLGRFDEAHAMRVDSIVGSSPSLRLRWALLDPDNPDEPALRRLLDDEGRRRGSRASNDRAVAAAHLGDAARARQLLEPAPFRRTTIGLALSQARVEAVLGEPDRALDALDLARRLGFNPTRHHDPCLMGEFRELRSDERFLALFPYCS